MVFLSYEMKGMKLKKKKHVFRNFTKREGIFRQFFSLTNHLDYCLTDILLKINTICVVPTQ